MNVPDRVKIDPRYSAKDFKHKVLPRLSTGDQRLWDEFSQCVGYNTADDPLKTIEMFRRLPVRGAADTHEKALDFLLFIPVAIDNVSPPRLVSVHGIDPVHEYEKMIKHICQVYTIRWHGRP